MPRKAIGSCNPGGDESKIQPVYELTAAQERVRKKHVKAKVLLGKAAEMKAAAEALAKEADCKHEVFNDTDGFIYDMRTCYICGTFLGTV